jgi:hypothetical protein
MRESRAVLHNIIEKFRIASSVVISVCLAVLVIHHIPSWSRGAGRTELSMKLRGLNSHNQPSSLVDIHTTASPHSTNPLVITPDIAKALNQADTVIKSTKKLLGSDHDDDEEEDDGNENIAQRLAASASVSNHVKPVEHPSSPTSSHHVQETPQELAKERSEAELWKTEQAMKNELDVQTAHKSGKLWENTVNIVHRTDPSAKLISKLNPNDAAVHEVKKAISLKRVENKPESMGSRLKAELDEKTKNEMGELEAKTVAIQKQGLDQAAHESKVAETADAHKSMPLGDMKKMLTSQLDNSVQHVVQRAKQLQGFSSNSQLEKRLKSELDAKTEAQEKQLLKSQGVKRSLVLARRKLNGRVSRAAKVRMQLSKEMREEDAIRKQLDMRAAKAGKVMLKREISGSGTPLNGKGHGESREALEAALRNRLESRAQQILKSSPHHSSGKATVDEHHLQDYLRQQLDASDKSTQKQLYRRTLKGNLLKGMNRHTPAAMRARQLHAAALRLFKTSLQRSRRGALKPAEDQAAARQSPDVHSATVQLMKEALARSGGHEPFEGLHRREAIESRAAAAQQQSRGLDVHTALERVMESSLERAKGVRPFAKLHPAGSDDLVVHDMANANRESTLRAGGLERRGKLDALVLGHYAELQRADATAEMIQHARSKTVHQAEQEEERAVE